MTNSDSDASNWKGNPSDQIVSRNPSNLDMPNTAEMFSKNGSRETKVIQNDLSSIVNTS